MQSATRKCYNLEEPPQLLVDEGEWESIRSNPREDPDKNLKLISAPSYYRQFRHVI